MKYKDEIKKTVYLSTPLVLGQLGHMMMSVTDNVMVGKLGSVPLAAASVSNALFSLVMIVGFGISISITPLTAIAFGARRHKECGVILRQGLMVNMVSALVLCAVSLLMAESIRYLDQPPEIVAPAVTYLKTLGFSMLPVMLFQSYRQFAEGVSILKPAMVITLAANIINVLANWVLIYGNLGVSPMGLTGAGLATFSSRTFMALSMIVVVTASAKFKKFRPAPNDGTVDLKIIKRLLEIGIPAGCQYLFEVSAFAGSSVIIGWMGTKELAAHQIALNLASLSFMVAMGISAAAMVRVGNAMGRKSIRQVRMAGFSAAMFCALVMGIFGLLFVSLRSVLPALYISEKDVIGIASTLLVVVAFFQISDGMQAVGLGILQGMVDMKMPTMITFTAYWVIGIPSGYLLGFKYGMGAMGVWIGLLLSLSFAAFMMILRFHKRTGYNMNPYGICGRFLDWA